MKNLLLYALVIITTLNSPVIINAQIFTKVSSTTNPIVTDPNQTFYAGASWIDYDNDNLLDLYVVRGGLYHNDGNGAFTKVLTSGIGLTTGVGNTWADVDNDGDIDFLLSGGNAAGTKFYINNGDGTFTQNTNGPFAIGTKLRSWGSAFGDYNNDGLVDLFLAAPFGPFIAVVDSSKFLINIGSGDFVRVDTMGITDTVDAYTVPTWSDYDNDGDVDLFIGSGRVNGSLSWDYLYNNNLKEGGNKAFTRITSDPLGNGLHDGQVWNWIDFDNDGDLDAYLTNYTGTAPNIGYVNEMYRNDIGSFTKLTATEVGPIVTDVGISLSSTWGDFDNDGDQDCLVTNEGNQKNCYYQNNIRQGSSVFTKITNEAFVLENGRHFCAASADYDNDGDLDMFISAAIDKGLYQNNLSSKTDFININLKGNVSNKSAIGAKVRVKAKGFWQMREISSQNTFNGMNMLNAHFGFGNSGITELIIDTILIEWPSGLKDICTNVPANKFYSATEGECLKTTATNDKTSKHSGFYIDSVFPNPVKKEVFIKYHLSRVSEVYVKIIDASGSEVFKSALPLARSGINSASINLKELKSGYYTLILFDGKLSISTKLIKID